VQGDKRKGAYQKSIAKKKRKIGEGSSSMLEGDEFKHDLDHIPPEHLKEQLKVYTMVDKMEDPEVVDAKPIGFLDFNRCYINLIEKMLKIYGSYTRQSLELRSLMVKSMR
jgi:hypothetical protein